MYFIKLRVSTLLEIIFYKKTLNCTFKPDVAHFYAICVTISLFSGVYAEWLIPDNRRFKLKRFLFLSLLLSALIILSGF